MSIPQINDAVSMLNFDDAEDEKALTVSQQHNRRSSGDSAFSSVSIASSTDPTTKVPVCIISRRANGPGREILKRCLSVCPSVTFSFRTVTQNALLYFLETLQVHAPCHGGVLYSF